MAVQLIKGTHNWIGLSSDTKPTRVPYPGSTFHETDTGKKFVYRNGAWTEDIIVPYVIDPDTLDPVLMTQPLIKTDNLEVTPGLAAGAAKDDQYPAGAGTNGTVTLTNANTAYAVPAVAPAGKFVLTLVNLSGSTIYFGFQNTNANGLPLYSGDSTNMKLGANQQVYAYSDSAGVAITYTLKLVA